MPGCFVWRGNNIAYCSANSITVEGPYHSFSRRSNRREAPQNQVHRQVTVVGAFETKGDVLLREVGWKKESN